MSLKFFPALCLCFIGCASIHKPDDLKGEWIVVSGRGPVGMIFDFKNEKEALISSIWKDSTALIDYEFKQNGTLVVDYRGKKRPLGKIERIKNDSLTILVDNGDRFQLKRIESVELNLRSADLIGQLKNSSWFFRYGLYTTQIDYMSTYRWGGDHPPLEAMLHSDSTPIPNRRESWYVGEYKGKLFMYLTFNFQFDGHIRQITKAGADEIVLHGRDIHIKKKRMNPSAIHIHTLTSRSLRSVRLDTLYLRTWSNGLARDENDALAVQDLLKQVEFRFQTDSTYSILLDGKEWKKGRWTSTNNNEFVILDDVRNPSNWIELHAEGDHVILTKSHKIKDSEWGYKLYMLTIEAN